MKNKTKLSRRNFVKSTAFASGAMFAGAASSTTPGCSRPAEKKLVTPFGPDEWTGKPGEGVTGLLFSQVGYEPGLPVRIVVRLPVKEAMNDKVICRLIPVYQEGKYSTDCNYWGEIWKSHWWVAEFRDIQEAGQWNVEIIDNGKRILQSEELSVGKNIFWDKTAILSSVDMLERRSKFSKVGAGWQDAGTLWVESCAQSAMIIALEDMLELNGGRLDEACIERLHKQITVGCDYLVMTQEKARELGYPDGAMSHDLLGHEHDILPNDAVKAVVALWRAARMLPGKYEEKKERYREAAARTYNWLRTTDKRCMGSYGFSFRQRGIPEDTSVPTFEFMTRDLVFMCWGALEKWRAEGEKAKDMCIEYAREIMDRQVTQDNPEAGFYGHFREFASLPHTENSWVHGIVNNEFGTDIGGLYPNYLMCFVEMLKLWPDHDDAEKWKKTLEDFTYGFLIPGCEKNPFLIVPLGIFGDEGALFFGGPFHGTDSIYGYTAAMAMELSGLFNEEKLVDIAYGNLQWLAGLNAGITKENLKACVVYSTDVPEGVAWPSSLICNIGNRWSGTWFSTRGVICNGFSTGEQFRMDTDPVKANDAPSSLTDEDWIPHSAGWLSGILRLDQ